MRGRNNIEHLFHTHDDYDDDDDGYCMVQQTKDEKRQQVIRKGRPFVCI